jgi:hypothetical protein
MALRKDEGWKRYAKALDPKRFKAALRRNMRKASILNGKIVEAAIRSAIRGGGFEKNAALTVMIKGSSKPLVDRGELFKAITSVVIGDAKVFIGVVQTNEFYDLAMAIHDGANVKVTPAMRGLFFVLWQASIGKMDPTKLSGRAAELWERAPGGWLPLKASTSNIIIPERRFIESAFEDGALKDQILANWNMAFKATMREVARQK